MLARAFRLFLALLLCWSALATQEWPLAQTDGGETVAAETNRGASSAAPGSVEAHHLDDQPGQAGEKAVDLPAWFPATRLLLAFDGFAVRLAVHDARAPRLRALDVPQRPPCA